MDAASYLTQLQALLPKGLAWPRRTDSVLAKFLAGLAEDFAQTDARAAAQMSEWDPRYTTELLSDWESLAGLPDDCITALGVEQTIAQRQAALYAKVTAVGGANAAFFIEMAERFGYADASIEHRFRPMECTDGCTTDLCSAADSFVWILNLPDTGGDDPMTCVSGCDEALQSWGDKAIECRVSAIAPAHTTVLFAYV